MTVIVPPEAEADTRVLSGEPVVGSDRVEALIALAILVARESAVSPATTVWNRSRPLIVVVRTAPAGKVPVTTAVCEAGEGPATTNCSVPLDEMAAVKDVDGSIGVIVSVAPLAGGVQQLADRQAGRLVQLNRAIDRVRETRGQDRKRGIGRGNRIGQGHIVQNEGHHIPRRQSAGQGDDHLGGDRRAGGIGAVLASWIEQARSKGGPASAVRTVTTAPTAETANKSFNGRPE